MAGVWMPGINKMLTIGTDRYIGCLLYTSSASIPEAAGGEAAPSVQESASLGQEAKFPVSAPAYTGFDLESAPAVSYTHLDVYKRQDPVDSAGGRSR